MLSREPKGPFFDPKIEAPFSKARAHITKRIIKRKYSLSMKGDQITADSHS